MAKDARFGAAQPAGIDDARVIERVAHHHVLGTGQRRDQAQIGHVAGAEQQRALGARERREFALERLVDVEVSVDQPGPAGRAPVLARGRARRGYDAFVPGQIQVVGPPQPQGRLAVHPQPGTLTTLDAAQLPPQGLRFERGQTRFQAPFERLERRL